MPEDPKTRDTEDLEARGDGEDEMEEEEMATKDEVTKAVEECFAEGGEAYDLDGNAAIDAVIAKLESMKDAPEMGGLGIGEQGMPLPEEEA